MRERLGHTYSGEAYPVHWGGRREREPVHIAGAFHVEDFQDGAGRLLSNGEEHPFMGWVVSRRNWHKIKPIQRSTQNE